MPYDYDPEDKFGYKDTLPENHPEKVITGVEFDDEFKKIETAINTLEDVALGDGQFVDAPDDNQLYGRKNQDWEVVPDASGFLTDAPSDGKQYARQDSAWSVVQASGDSGAGLVISENEPADKVTGMQWLEADTGIVWIWDDGKWLQFPAGSSGSSSVAWDDISGKPLTYAPSAHTHEISEVNGLQDALDAGGYDDAQVKADIQANTDAIAVNAGNISTNTSDISDNATEIAKKLDASAYVPYDDTDVKADIAANTAAIATKLDADKIWTGTEAEYNNLSPDANTLYFIV